MFSPLPAEKTSSNISQLILPHRASNLLIHPEPVALVAGIHAVLIPINRFEVILGELSASLAVLPRDFLARQSAQVRCFNKLVKCHSAPPFHPMAVFQTFTASLAKNTLFVVHPQVEQNTTHPIDEYDLVAFPPHPHGARPVSGSGCGGAKTSAQSRK